MCIKFENNVVVITGGSGLLGKEFVRAVATQGGIGVIADINTELGLKVKEELSNDFKDHVDFVRLDITSKSSIQECIKFTIKKYGKIDALVNNAYPRNSNYGKDFFDVEYEDFCENVNIHLGGYFLTTQQFAKYFRKQCFGNIINIASIYGVIAPKFEIYQNTGMTMPIEYAMIKSAILHLTKYMAGYLKGTGIRVNSLSPGGILNNQDKKFVQAYNNNCSSKGMLDKNDILGALLFLLSEDAKYINGHNLIIDDGFTL